MEGNNVSQHLVCHIAVAKEDLLPGGGIIELWISHRVPQHGLADTFGIIKHIFPQGILRYKRILPVIIRYIPQSGGVGKHVPETNLLESLICDVKLRNQIPQPVVQIKRAAFHKLHYGRGCEKLGYGGAVEDITFLKRSTIRLSLPGVISKSSGGAERFFSQGNPHGNTGKVVFVHHPVSKVADSFPQIKSVFRNIHAIRSIAYIHAIRAISNIHVILNIFYIHAIRYIFHIHFLHIIYTHNSVLTQYNSAFILYSFQRNRQSQGGRCLQTRRAQAPEIHTRRSRAGKEPGGYPQVLK